MMTRRNQTASILLLALHTLIISFTLAGPSHPPPAPATVALGDTCDDTHLCVTGTVCDSGTSICIDFVPQGSPCDNVKTFCNSDLTCDQGNTNTCIPIQ